MIAYLHLHDPYARSAPLFRAIASEIMNNTVPADDLAPLGARTSAGAVVIKLGSLYVRERYLNGYNQRLHWKQTNSQGQRLDVETATRVDSGTRGGDTWP